MRQTAEASLSQIPSTFNDAGVSSYARQRSLKRIHSPSAVSFICNLPRLYMMAAGWRSGSATFHYWNVWAALEASGDWCSPTTEPADDRRHAHNCSHAEPTADVRRRRFLSLDTAFISVSARRTLPPSVGQMATAAVESADRKDGVTANYGRVALKR